MEEEFKKALKQMRQSSKNEGFGTFSQSLERVEWFDHNTPDLLEQPDNNSNTKQNKFTERLKTLDELTNFTSGEFSKKPNTNIISIPGGAQIVKKEENFAKVVCKSLNELQEENKQQGFGALNIKYEHLKEEDGVEVLFVCESATNLSEMKTNILDYYYDESVSQLFQKMIGAMKLKKQSYLLSCFSIQVDTKLVDKKDTLLSEIALFKPKVVITLGGRVSMDLLETEKRLQVIHGQFFDFTLSSSETKTFQTKLMPMFSPSFINEAPNTKRIAWEDMQKVMKELNIVS